MAEETWKGVIFMTPIELIEKEIRSLHYRILRAKRKANTPQSELDNLHTNLKLKEEILEILKQHTND